MGSAVQSLARAEQAGARKSGAPRIDDLLVLARDKSTASRNQLVAALGGLFCDAPVATAEAERDLMAQILRSLIHEVELQVRANLAEQLAKDDNAPPDLIATLANDDIEVAHAILVASNALDDAELIEIIARRTRQHRVAIATRDAVSENVSDALVGSGETDVMVTLIGNDGAAISDGTLAELVEASREQEAFQSPLLNRNELSPRLARQMYWWVSAALRKHIANSFDIDSIELDGKIVSSVQNILGVQEQVDLPADGLDELARKLAERNGISSELLIDTLRRHFMLPKRPPGRETRRSG